MIRYPAVCAIRIAPIAASDPSAPDDASVTTPKGASGSVVPGVSDHTSKRVVMCYDRQTSGWLFSLISLGPPHVLRDAPTWGVRAGSQNEIESTRHHPFVEQLFRHTSRHPRMSSRCSHEYLALNASVTASTTSRSIPGQWRPARSRWVRRAYAAPPVVDANESKNTARTRCLAWRPFPTGFQLVPDWFAGPEVDERVAFGCAHVVLALVPDPALDRHVHKGEDLFAKKSGNIFRVGIFLDFVWLTTRTPHGAYVRRARRNRVDHHGGEIERLTTRTCWANSSASHHGMLSDDLQPIAVTCHRHADRCRPVPTSAGQRRRTPTWSLSYASNFTWGDGATSPTGSGVPHKPVHGCHWRTPFHTG